MTKVQRLLEAAKEVEQAKRNIILQDEWGVSSRF